MPAQAAHLSQKKGVTLNSPIHVGPLHTKLNDRNRIIPSPENFDSLTRSQLGKRWGGSCGPRPLVLGATMPTNGSLHIFEGPMAFHLHSLRRTAEADVKDMGFEPCPTLRYGARFICMFMHGFLWLRFRLRLPPHYFASVCRHFPASQQGRWSIPNKSPPMITRSWTSQCAR